MVNKYAANININKEREPKLVLVPNEIFSDIKRETPDYLLIVKALWLPLYMASDSGGWVL